jgi:hypothetical protein
MDYDTVKKVIPRGDGPVYIDHNLFRNARGDGSRNFQNYSCINNSQEQINSNMQNQILDYTTRYRPCYVTDSQKQQMSCGNLSKHPDRQPTLNDIAKKLHPTKTYDGTGFTGEKTDFPNTELSQWGINNSGQNSVTRMTDSFLQMKHRQEMEQLRNNTHNYPGLIDSLKDKQARELQMRLGNPQTGNVDAIGGGVGASVCAGVPSRCVDLVNQKYGPQGQFENSRNRVNPHNKYEHLKYLSPRDVSQMYGHAGDEPVINNCDDMADTDIFDLTSWSTKIKEKPKLAMLKEHNDTRQQQIMSQRGPLRSFNQLEDTYMRLN